MRGEPSFQGKRRRTLIRPSAAFSHSTREKALEHHFLESASDSALLFETLLPLDAGEKALEHHFLESASDSALLFETLLPRMGEKVVPQGGTG